MEINYYSTKDGKTYFKVVQNEKMLLRFTSNGVELKESPNDCPFVVGFVASKWVSWQKGLI